MKSLADVSKELGISYLTLYRLTRAGYVRAVKIGKQWRISEEEVSRIKVEGVSFPTSVINHRGISLSEKSA